MTLALAMILDAWLGEPRWLWTRLPHPAVVMGRIIGWFDKSWNAAPNQKTKGTLAMIVAGIGAIGLGLALQAIPGQVADVVVVAILLAQKSLVDHVRAVADGLRTSVQDGRSAVAMIVSRDTAAMDTPAIARSAIESGAENLSDGVIAPAFWFLVAGLPGVLLYKITNTADSMIGYRTPRHKDFGWAAARFDDLLNLGPARLTAALVWLAGGARGTWAAIYADAKRHKSPNAGWPEAALSRAIGVSLAGPRSYDGAISPFPYVNDGAPEPAATDIVAATGVMWRTWAIFLGLVVLIALL